MHFLPANFIRSCSPSYFGMLNGFLHSYKKDALCDYLASREAAPLLQMVSRNHNDALMIKLDEDDLIMIFDMVSFNWHSLKFEGHLEWWLEHLSTVQMAWIANVLVHVSLCPISI